jgi:diketogulonate reductase-like aldo/keto reductase
MMSRPYWNRRDAVLAIGAAAFVPRTIIAAVESMLTRPIPRSGEPLPVFGLGTWQVFDVAGSAEELAIRSAIVDMLIDKGGSVIDSSPMYARSEEIIGEVIGVKDIREHLFLATKVWTDGESSGKTQMQRSFDLIGAEIMDLMQVHNLRDADTHMGTIREWQQDGRIRYSGLTDYQASALNELENAMRELKPDFIQINYSLAERDADKRLLPAARDQGVAVLVNRPFVTGRLFSAVRGQEVPDWATSFAASWGQFFLKYIISHPAVSCVIPATSKLEHRADNLAAGAGELPDESLRRRMAAFIDAI